MEQCRICANSDVNKSQMFKLFEKNHLVEYIQIFTGLLLTRQFGMPEYICDTCLQDLECAIKFRERCIATQNELSRNCGDNSTKIDITIKDKVDEFISLPSQLNDGSIKMTTLDDESVNDTVEELNEEMDEELWMIEYVTSETECDNSLVEATVYEKLSENVEETLNKRIKKIDAPIVCELCGKSFNFIGNFREHQLRHTGIKKFNCQLCNYKFYTNKELVRHVRRHTGERPYPCTYCDSRFADLSTKAQHEKRHMDERDFKCEKCDKSFVTSGCLKKHMLTHTGIRSHCCTVCNQWFLRGTHLSTHLRSKGHKHTLANQEQKNKIIVI